MKEEKVWVKPLATVSCNTPGWFVHLIKGHAQEVSRPVADMLIERGLVVLAEEGDPRPAQVPRSAEELRVKVEAAREGVRRTLRARWPHKMEPEEYLERYPKGRSAELARMIVGRERVG